MMAEIRRLIRDECAERCLDERLRSYGEQAEQEMVETLQLALLCAAEASEKRPTMKQVVGLIKDVRRQSSELSATTRVRAGGAIPVVNIAMTRRERKIMKRERE